MSLDKMIADAQKRAEESEGEAKFTATIEAQALTRAKEAGYTLTQEDLNRVDKQNKDALNTLRQDMEKTLGSGWDEFKKTLQDTLSDEPELEGSEAEGDNPATLQRIFSELEKRDKALEDVRAEGLAFQRELKQERLTSDINRRLKDLGLQDPYQDAAREFLAPRMDQIVEIAMKGQDVEEHLQAQAEKVKNLSGVWFEKPPDPNDVTTPRLPNGRLPSGGEPRQLTDAERLERSESVI